MSKEIENEQLDAIMQMRDMMERTSKFLSLSGLAGILVGCIALIGVGITYLILDMPITLYGYLLPLGRALIEKENTLVYLIINSISVLALSLLVGSLLAVRSAKRKGLSITNNTTKRLVINMMIPLLVGGFFVFALLLQQNISIILPSMLIFYGMALLNASKYSIEEIRHLGVIEMLLGLAAMYFLDQALILWAIGFGLLHIIYGILLYNKYEK